MLRTVRDNLFSTLFPQPCFGCGAALIRHSLGNACENCWRETKIFEGSEEVCIKCGRPDISARHVRCSQCDGHNYDRARSVGIYSRALQAAVVGLKTQPHIPEKLRSLLVQAFARSEFSDANLIVPVPLSKERRLERGFNQAEIIAESLGKAVGLPVDSHSLVRTKHSAVHRAGMDKKARDMSVRDSFEIFRPKLIDGQNVLLVDDVLTTGATVSYCARTLKKCGATQVNVLTIARAV